MRISLSLSERYCGESGILLCTPSTSRPSGLAEACVSHALPASMVKEMVGIIKESKSTMEDFLVVMHYHLR